MGPRPPREPERLSRGLGVGAAGSHLGFPLSLGLFCKRKEPLSSASRNSQIPLLQELKPNLEPRSLWRSGPDFKGLAKPLSQQQLPREAGQPRSQTDQGNVVSGEVLSAGTP